MKNKNEIMEEIKVLKNSNPNQFKGLKKELKEYIAHLSTDEDSDYSVDKIIPKKQELKLDNDLKEYFKSLGDKRGTSDLLLDLVEKDFYEINKHLNFEGLDNVEVLRTLSNNICSNEYRGLYDIKNDVALSIYVEVKTQLELLGEDVADIISHYDFV